MNLYDQMNIETKAKRIYEYAFYRMINAVKEEKERLVTLQDVSHFKWDNKNAGKVGFV